MTEKRYSDGTLAKWYYSQTDVISDGDNEYYLRNKESVKDFNYNELLGTNDLLDELNKLSDENEQLKQFYKEFEDECQSTFNAMSRKQNDLYRKNFKLKEENEQLKSELRNLRDFRGFITEKNVFNEKERKKLQLQMLRLYNYFQNYFEDTMSPESFSKMWDTVKESEKWEKGEF